MKEFLFLILITFVSFIILLETTVRVFELAGKTMQVENINGNYLLKPGVKGEWIRGGIREIHSSYSINRQGFNSLKDFSLVDSNKINVALIGDSYIEGFHVDVNNSIGSLIEDLMNDSIVVHEYGISGANIVDFMKIYNEFINDRYEYVFILVGTKDLIELRASKMGQGHRIPKEVSLLRRLYIEAHFLRYLNINHGLTRKLDIIADKFLDIRKDEQNSELANQLNMDAINRIDFSVVFMYERENLESEIIDTLKHSFLEVNKIFIPEDHGFDGHWNLNGRKNCALSIVRYIKINGSRSK